MKFLLLTAIFFLGYSETLGGRIFNTGQIGIVNDGGFKRNARHISNSQGGQIGIVNEHNYNRNARHISNTMGGQIGIVNEHNYNRNARHIQNTMGGQIGIVNEQNYNRNARHITNTMGGQIGIVNEHNLGGMFRGARKVINEGGEIGTLHGNGESVDLKGGEIGVVALPSLEEDTSAKDKSSKDKSDKAVSDRQSRNLFPCVGGYQRLGEQGGQTGILNPC